MKYIQDEIIEEMRQRINIVDVISDYMRLKQSGKNYIGLCPFHQEKTPSFHVNTNLQIFKCFGCGKAGNVYHFLQYIDQISFPEAVQKIADRLGVSLNIDHDNKYSKKDVLALMDWTTHYFINHLKNYGKQAQEYITQRGIQPYYQAKFCLGFAPNEWELLLQTAQKEGFTIEMLEASGLISKSKKQSNKYFDYFRNRLIFPIWNLDGKVIAFGGRVLDDSQPKYLNSPDTDFFNKSQTLYAFPFAKEMMQQKNELILMEGYTDVLMAHQFGFTNTVATLGTALTEEHTKIIRRYVDKVILIYDGDGAGQKASERAIPLFLKQGILLKLVVLPEKKDPCEYLLSYGKDAMASCLEHAEEFWDFTLHKYSQQYDISTVSGKQYAIQEVMKIAQSIPDETTKALVAQKISEYFKISSQAVLTQATVYPRYKPVVTPAQQQMQQNFTTKLIENDEKFLIWVVMHYTNIATWLFQQYPLEEYTITKTKNIATLLFNLIQNNQPLDLGSICSQLELEESNTLINIYYSTDYNIESDLDLTQRIQLVLNGLKRRQYLKKQAELKKLYQETEDKELKSKIAIELQNLGRNFLFFKTNHKF